MDRVNTMRKHGQGENKEETWSLVNTRMNIEWTQYQTGKHMQVVTSEAAIPDLHVWLWRNQSGIAQARMAYDAVAWVIL